MVHGIHHAGITVSDLERSLALYRDILGLELQFVVERAAPDVGLVVGYPGARLRVAFLHIPGTPTRLELVQYLHPTGTRRQTENRDPGTGHVCFEVDDVDRIYQRLAAAGVELLSAEPVEITDGPSRGAVALCFKDPDGHVLELLKPPPGR